MISKSEYEVLKMLLESPNLDEVKFIKEIRSLKQDNLIKLHSAGLGHLANGQVYIRVKGYDVTSKGKRAIEEYENFIANVKRENHTVEIAEEANYIAKTANKKSHNANVLSIIAIVLSSIFSIAALIVSILK